MREHKLKGIASSRRIWLDDVELHPEESQQHQNHSPDGFNWGYGGSGPAQLALAIILKCDESVIHYQTFKWNIIAQLPQNNDFEIKFTL